MTVTHVVGANPKTKNIGHEIAQAIRALDTWSSSVHEHSPSTNKKDGPDIDFSVGDNLVVATGMVHNENIIDVVEAGEDINSYVVESNLVLVMNTVAKFVHDVHSRHGRGPRIGGSRRNIVILGSMAYRKPLTGMSAYCAAKAGLDMYAKCAAWELGPLGFDVFIVHPGSVEDTPMAQNMIDQMAEAKQIPVEEASEKWHTASAGTNRLLQKTDIAQMVAWLVSGKAPMASGTSIEMNGGQR